MEPLPKGSILLIYLNAYEGYMPYPEFNSIYQNVDDEEIVDVKMVWCEVKEVEKERDVIDKKVEGYLKELKY
jgi:hypothetical protein